MPRLAQSLTPQRKDSILNSIKNLIPKRIYKSLSLLLSPCCIVNTTSIKIVSDSSATNKYRIIIDTTPSYSILDYTILNVMDNTAATPTIGIDGTYDNGIITSQIISLVPGNNLTISGIVLYGFTENLSVGVYIQIPEETLVVPTWS